MEIQNALGNREQTQYLHSLLHSNTNGGKYYLDFLAQEQPYSDILGHLMKREWIVER
jgi:hypothetical protein